MRLTYPAIFSPFEEGNGFTVVFPDLPGCVTEGKDLTEAILMAQDAASGWILDELENVNKIPVSSSPTNIKTDDGEFVSVIVIVITDEEQEEI